MDFLASANYPDRSGYTKDSTERRAEFGGGMKWGLLSRFSGFQGTDYVFAFLGQTVFLPFRYFQ
jgi:hypothetical protein